MTINFQLLTLHLSMASAHLTVNLWSQSYKPETPPFRAGFGYKGLNYLHEIILSHFVETYFSILSTKIVTRSSIPLLWPFSPFLLVVLTIEYIHPAPLIPGRTFSPFSSLMILLMLDYTQMQVPQILVLMMIWNGEVGKLYLTFCDS